MYRLLSFRGFLLVLVCSLCSGCSGVGQNASILVAGEVVNEQGQRLDQVRLDERTSRFSLTAESFTTSTTSSVELKDGRFRVSCRSCRSIELSFSSPGYYSETVVAHVGTRDPENGQMTDSPPVDLTDENMRVVLRSNANRVRLVEYSGQLQTGQNGVVTVVPIRKDLGTRGVEPARLDKVPSKNARFLPGYVDLVAVLTPDGNLAELEMPDSPGARFAIPVPPTVDFSKADGGILFYKRTGMLPGEVYREMRTAPVDGYASTLEIPTRQRSGAIFFYCKIGNQYGKGKIGLPDFSHSDDGERVVRVYVEMRLNPDGSRNVETAR